MNTLTPTRRDSIRLGAACVLGGQSLPQLLRLKAQSAEQENRSIPATAVIFVTVGGGPSQFEAYDPKPDALSDYRSSFGSVPTSVPGVHFCELLPMQARLMDKLAIICSIAHRQASHIAETGYDLRNSINSSCRPRQNTGG